MHRGAGRFSRVSGDHGDWGGGDGLLVGGGDGGGFHF